MTYSYRPVWKALGWGFAIGVGGVLTTFVGCSNSDTKGGGGSNAGGAGVILDGGGKLPDAPNGQAACQSGTCNYQKQDCPSAGSCLPTDNPPAAGDWPPQCFTAGTTPAGSECSAWNECVAGYFCVGIGGTSDGGVSPGVCRKLCCGGDWSACPAGESCIQQVFLRRPTGGDAVYANADLCAPVNNCDVLDPNSCADQPGKSCLIADPIGNVACIPSGTGDLGDKCGPSTTTCKAGFACVDDHCRRLCRAEADGGTPVCPKSEGLCVHFARDPAGVGECTPTG
jgi:hypothetical protein